jgi:hypothetical protein
MALSHTIEALGSLGADKLKNKLFGTLLATFLPQRTIGVFQATVTIEEIATDDLEITQHPVQQGASITDHAFSKPATVSIRSTHSDTPAQLAETYAKLLKLQKDRIPMKVVTGKRTYKNMLMKTLTQNNDSSSETALQINFVLQEIFITDLQVVSIAPINRQALAERTASQETAGKKALQLTKEAEQVKVTSALKDLKGIVTGN